MLRQLGVTGSVYNLLQSYLSGRSQFVRLGDFVLTIYIQIGACLKDPYLIPYFI